MDKEPKNLPEQLSANNEGRNVKKKPSIAQRYIDVYDQSMTVLRQWDSNNPTFTCPLVDYQNLQTQSNLLGQYLRESGTAKTDKKANSTALQDCKTAVYEGSKILRIYIRAEYPTLPDLSVIYSEYGLEKNAEGGYYFPNDNGRMALGLETLINKLQERANPLANKEFGLAYWQDLKARHLAAWQTSEDIRSTRSGKASRSKDQAVLVRNLLSDLHSYIKTVNRRGDFRAALRSFGFLKETF